MSADAPTHRPGKFGKLLFAVLSEPIEGAGDRDAVREQHLAYQYELERRGVMFAAGPFLDAAGKPNGTGLIIYRAGSLAEATAIAAEDPFHRLGFRRFKVMPWRVSEGTFSLRVNYAAGTFEFD